MEQRKCAVIFIIWSTAILANGQDYEVADIFCSFGGGSNRTERLTARLRKPEGFSGTPIFADDRQLDPTKDKHCKIEQDQKDPEGLMYTLTVTDMSKCGVLKKNGFVNVRVWFPRLPGVVMMSDQEVIIMCKPAESVITTNKAAAFAGKLPPAARVSGIVEESPGKLEYEVALFREASAKDDVTTNKIPVDQAVPIGTKLQLRASINSESAWKYVKLLEVTISADPKDAYAKGHITLIENGCRLEEFYTILPRQPYRPVDNPGEVRMEFEAVLLDAQRDRANQLWIHAKIKACVVAADCVPEFCLDLYQPSGMGKRRRRDLSFESPKSAELVRRESSRNFFPISSTSSDKDSTRFGDNVGVTVILPGEEYYNGVRPTPSPPPAPPRSRSMEVQECQTYLIVGSIMGGLLIVASLMMCYLSLRLYKLSKRYKKEKLDEVVREHRRKYGGFVHQQS